MGERRSTRWVVVTLVLLACCVAQGFGRFTFALLLPAVKAELLGSYGLAGFIGTMNVAAYLLGTVAMSVLSTRFAAVRLMVSGLVLSSAGLLVLSAAHRPAVLVVGMALTGIGGALIYLPSPGVLAGVFPPEQRGLAIGLASIGIGGGIVFSSQLTNLVRWLADDGASWRPVWAIEGSIAVVVLVLAVALLRVPVTAPSSPPRLTALRHVDRWWALAPGYVTYGLAYILVMSYVVAMLEQQAGFGHAHASAAFALIGVAVTAGGVLFGRASDRWGRRATLVAGFVLASASTALLLAEREPFVSVAVLGFGAAFAGNITVIAAYIGDHAPPHEFGPAFAAVTLGFGAAQAVGPQLGGWIIDHTGSFTAVFVLSAAVWAVGAVLMAQVAGGRQPTVVPNSAPMP